MSHTRIWTVIAAAALGAGCFSPSYEDCQLTCERNEACPSDLSCVAGHCRTSAEPERTCEVIVGLELPPDAAVGAVDASTRLDAAPSPPDAMPPPPPDAMPLPDAAPPPIDAAPPPPPPPPPPPSDGLCDEDQPPVTPPCGGAVLCAKKIKATTVKARVIYAKDVKVSDLDADCVYESNGEHHWNQGYGGGDVNQPTVTADVIYVRDLDATSIEVIELRAKRVSDH